MKNPNIVCIDNYRGWCYIVKETHISQIVPGNTILHEGAITTVCKNNIQYDAFNGKSLFGKTYMLGYKKVKKIEFVLHPEK